MAAEHLGKAIQGGAGSGDISGHVTRLKASFSDNEKFDQAVHALRSDKSITKQHMREVAGHMLGYHPKASNSRDEHLQAIVNRQTMEARGTARAATLDKPLSEWGKS